MIEASGLSGADFLSSSGAPLTEDFGQNSRWLLGGASGPVSKIAWRERGWNIAQINHYIVRTPDHFRLKRLRGRGWLANAEGKRNSRHTDDFYDDMNRNEAVDRSILFHEEALTQRMSLLLENDTIAAAQARAQHRVFERLKASVWV